MKCPLHRQNNIYQNICPALFVAVTSQYNVAMEQIENRNLFQSGHTLAWSFFEQYRYPWEILPNISQIIVAIGKTLDPEKYDNPSENVWIAKNAIIAPSADIHAPAIIGERTELRHCAFIRGSALVGNDCVVGNSVELKNCIMFDCSQAPHFNYIGDSILGYMSHTGAGAITSNLKSDKSKVVVHNGSVSIETNLLKFGAILADNVEVGCNSVLNPGTIVCRNTNIYPASSVRGVIPANSIYKSGKYAEIVKKNLQNN